MPAVRIVGSLLSSKELGDAIAEGWGIPVDDCRLLSHNVNDHYVVRTGAEHYIARLYGTARGGPAEVAYEVAFAAHAAAGGVRVAAPVTQGVAAAHQVLDAPEGPRVLVLWTAAPGLAVGPDDAQAYGREVARLHVAGDSLADAPSRRALDPDYLVSSRTETVRALWSTADARARFDQLVDRITEQLATGEGERDWGACHGDTNGGNAHVSDDGLMLFDMEFAGPGPRVYDLATLRWATLWREGWGAAWDGFLRGYLDVRPAPDLHRLDLYVAVRSVWLLGHWAGVESTEPLATWQPERNLLPVLSLAEAALARATH